MSFKFHCLNLEVFHLVVQLFELISQSLKLFGSLVMLLFLLNLAEDLLIQSTFTPSFSAMLTALASLEMVSEGIFSSRSLSSFSTANEISCKINLLTGGRLMSSSQKYHLLWQEFC